MTFPRKINIVIAGTLVILTLCGTLWHVRANETATGTNRSSLPNYQSIDKEAALKSGLCAFDKVQDAQVFVSVLDGKINSANVFLETQERITDAEKETIKLYISEHLEGLEEENIQIQYAVL